MESRTTRRWILKNKPQGLPVVDRRGSRDSSAIDNQTFTLVTITLPKLAENQALVKPVYFSNDPAQRVWMSLSSADCHPERTYAPPIEVGDPITAFAIAEVVESRCSNMLPGNLVYGRVSWSDFAVMDKTDCLMNIGVPAPGLSITHFMGSLGLSGLTAYYGLHEIVKATASDAVVISGAAGAVGMMAVQIAKRVIGCHYVRSHHSYEQRDHFMLTAFDV
jgi:NADPH-dependent curcumin reductase CurA